MTDVVEEVEQTGPATQPTWDDRDSNIALLTPPKSDRCKVQFPSPSTVKLQAGSLPLLDMPDSVTARELYDLTHKGSDNSMMPLVLDGDGAHTFECRFAQWHGGWDNYKGPLLVMSIQAEGDWYVLIEKPASVSRGEDLGKHWCKGIFDSGAPDAHTLTTQILSFLKEATD